MSASAPSCLRRRIVHPGLSLVLGWCVATEGGAAGGRPRPPPNDILIVADAAPEWENAPQPTSDKPMYYFPVFVGFRDLGAVVAGEKIPVEAEVRKNLIETLRGLGYRPADKSTPPATILLCFAWGTLNPDVVVNPGANDDGSDAVYDFNRRQMLAFLGAHKVADKSYLSPDREKVIEETREDQYFLAVAAYDLQSVLAHKRRLLWMTRIATESRRVTLPDVLPTMVASGSKLFGHGAADPVWIDPADTRKAKVEIGEPIIIEQIPADATEPKPETPSEPQKRKR